MDKLEDLSVFYEQKKKKINKQALEKEIIRMRGTGQLKYFCYIKNIKIYRKDYTFEKKVKGKEWDDDGGTDELKTSRTGQELPEAMKARDKLSWTSISLVR